MISVPALIEALADIVLSLGREVAVRGFCFGCLLVLIVAVLAGCGGGGAASSGTAALHVAVLATDTGPGDEVIVPAYTWIATANAVELTGAKPVFCDIDLATFNLDTKLIDQGIG